MTTWFFIISWLAILALLIDAGMEEKRKISTEKALAILKEKGISLTQEEAEQVVEFLY